MKFYKAYSSENEYLGIVSEIDLEGMPVDVELVEEPSFDRTAYKMKGFKGDVGEIVFYSRDLGKQLSIKEYLKTILLELWEQKDGFSGKRPFRNSGWERDIYTALICAGVCDGSVDFYGRFERIDEDVADEIIRGVIESL